MATDDSLRHAMEELFASTEARVVTAFKVLKCAPSASSAWTRKKPPKSQGKERVVALTAVRRSKRRGFKGSLHSCKLSGGRWQVRNTWLLKSLLKIEAFTSAAGGDGMAHDYLELTFSNNAFTSETRVAFEVASEAVLKEFLGTIVLFCKKHERKVPQIFGYDMAELDKWLAEQGDGKGLEGLRGFGAALLGGEEEAAATEGGAAGGERSLVSAKEEKDLQALLDMFACGVGDVDEFQERLQAELAALEAANVHAILESGPVVGHVIERLDKAIGLIDDLEENLTIFDVKLRHMREDIAAIEARNNRLELQTRNNRQLLAALDSLLARLALPPATERALAQAEFDLRSLDVVVGAGWDLHEHLESLQDASETNPKGLGEGLGGMTAVMEQRARLQALAKSYADRGARFITNELGSVTESVLMRLSGPSARSSRGGAADVLDHPEVRQRAQRLAPLLEVMKALRPTCMPALREKYCSSVNTLLRKELRLYTGDLRKQIAAAVSSSPPEPDILKGAQAGKAGDVDSDTSMHAVASSQSLRGSRQAGALLPHRGYQAFLEAYIPMLLDEAEFLARVMLLYRTPDLPAITPPQSAALSSASGQPGSARANGAPAVPPATSKGVRFHNATPPAAKAAGSMPSSPGRGHQDGTPPGEGPPAAAAPVLGPEGVRACMALMDGIQADVEGLVDLVARSQQLLAVPMVGATLTWRARVAGVATAVPLVEVLDDCLARLVQHFERYVQDKVAAITRYDGKGAMSLADSVKGMHVLPFMASIVAVAARLEGLLAGMDGSATGRRSGSLTPSLASADGDELGLADSGEAAALDRLLRAQLAGEGTQAPQRGASDDAEGGAPGEARRRLDLGATPTSAQASSSNALLRSSSQLTPAAAEAVQIPDQLPAASSVRSARDVVDPAYALLIRASFATLERIAATDAKHGCRLRLENYDYLGNSLRQVAGGAPVLAWFQRHALSLREAAMQTYVQQQLEYGKLWKLLEFSMRVDTLLEDVGLEEVPFQLHYQAADLRALLATTMSHPEKKLAAMRQRIAKHLAASSPALVAQVWARCQAAVLERYSRLEEQVALCYSNLVLQPSPEQLAELFKTVS